MSGVDVGVIDPIPAHVPLRIVGDVHGDARAFAAAIETDRFIIQLGDLTDHGPDSAEALRLAFRLIDEGRGLFLLGNHDRKLGRALSGRRMRPDPALETTLAQLDASLRARALAEIATAPAWIRHGTIFFVHGGFHTGMLSMAPPPGLERVDHLLSRALFGEVASGQQPDGYPIRRLGWIDHIPPWLTVYCGHDRRSDDGQPVTFAGRRGGRAIFVDTGSGKGGHLSWIDLPGSMPSHDTRSTQAPPS